MAMFQCAYCSSEIEKDSLFCDQCGKEILLCETCKLPGRNQWCEEDGGALIAAKSISIAPGGDTAAASVRDTGSAGGATSSFDNTAKAPAAARLRLVNGNLGISLDIQPDSILGRTTGPYVASLGTLSSISGKHLLFKYDARNGWSFTDMGSSNGTKYSKTNIAWQQTSKVAPDVPVTLENKAYILIANVEFAIQIEGDSSTSTQRI